MPDPPPRVVDWEVAKRVIAVISEKAPALIAQAVIIGGVACWFYRQLLAKASDSDFKVPQFSEAQNNLWLSRDLDLTNFFAQDARDMLPNYIVRDEHGRQQLVLEGVPIGFAQVGVTFDPESAFVDSWIGSFQHAGSIVEFRVLDPITLYREKLALSQRRGAAADLSHCSLLGEFLRYETCRQTESLTSAHTLSDQSNPIKFLTAIRDRAPETCADNRLRLRIERSLTSATELTPVLRRLLQALSTPPA